MNSCEEREAEDSEDNARQRTAGIPRGGGARAPPDGLPARRVLNVLEVPIVLNAATAAAGPSANRPVNSGNAATSPELPNVIARVAGLFSLGRSM